MDTKILTTAPSDIRTAGEILKSGGLVAFPTETVYGLGANALDENAVRSIYAAKGRPSDNPLIVHIAEKDDILPLVEAVPPKAQALMDAFFPAPLTIILKKSPLVPYTTSGGLDTVAVRMPNNPVARALIKASGCPIAAPSANTSGLPSPTKAQHVIDDMRGKIDAIIDGGDCAVGVESTVITLATDVPTILRPGAVTKEMLEAVIGEVAVAPSVLEGMKEGEIAASPGMKYKHYAPKARVVLVEADSEAYVRFVNSRDNAFALCFDGDAVTGPKLTYGKENDPEEQARELFDALRQLDRLGVEKVYAHAPAKDGVSMAVYNRLIRAAAFTVIDLRKPFTVGLTGQTGAGKGYVCEMLAAEGFTVVDADVYARRLTEKNAPLLPKLQEAFGEDVVEGGELNRRLLAARAFASREKTDLLNRIMHPAIIEQCRAAADGLTVLDAPQLFEAQMEGDCYRVVSVVAPEDVRLQRIMARDGLTEAQALTRIRAQYGEDYYTAKSDYVIINDGIADVAAQMKRILAAIL